MISIKYKNISGIYKILNTVNNKIYIGSSVDIYSRIRCHFHTLKNNKHHNAHLQKSYNKYKKENFIVEIIEIVSDYELLVIREQYYFDILTPNLPNIGYNICTVAGNTLNKKFSEESKLKMSKSAIERFKKEKHPSIGKQRLDLIERNKKLKGSKCSEDKIKKLRISHKSNKVKQFTKENEFINEFISINEAARQTKICPGSIQKCCSGKRKTAGQFIWKFFD